jgi:putative ABC transport system permease protein
MQGEAYDSAGAKHTLVRQTLERLTALPGVETADVWQPDPPGENVLFTAAVKEGETADPSVARVIVRYKAVSPDALAHAGISLLYGRDISEADQLGTDSVAVVSQSLANHFWPGENAVGKRFRRTSRPEWYTVVGVAADVKHQGQLFPNANPRDTYFSLHQYPSPNISLVVKTAGDPAAATASLRQAIREIDPTLVLYKIRTLEEVVANEAKPARFASVLSALFAVLALVLASLGTYGVLAFSVSRRSGEFGIRLALGAAPGHIFGMVLREGTLLAATGLALGVLASVGISRWLTSMLFGISPVDPVTYTAILAILTALVLLACFVPARRATRVDPVVALRAE